MAVGGDRLLKDCIEIFQKKIEHMGNECGNADALILDNYIPADGDYIVVKKDGSVVRCSIKMDKKAGSMKISYFMIIIADW